MIDHAANRTDLIEALRHELFGPDPSGQEIDVSDNLTLEEQEGGRQPYRQRGTGEEVLTRDSPIKRYGVGVLFPFGAPLHEGGVHSPDEGDGEPADVIGGGELPPSAHLGEAKGEEEHDADDFDVSMANAYQPSSIGVSFLAEILSDSSLVVEATGGRYHRRTVLVRGKDDRIRPRTWWLRAPVTFRAEFPAEHLTATTTRMLVAGGELAQQRYILTDAANTEGLDLRVEVLSRPHRERQRLLTVCVVNRTSIPGRTAPNEECLFQTHFTASIRAGSGDHLILPYPTANATGDEEQLGLDLLYRHVPTFATGHGCAADWRGVPGVQRVAEVSAACLPVVQTPNITPDITREDGTHLVVSMASLAGLVPGDNGWDTLNEAITQYEAWIARQSAITANQTIDERYRHAARDHLNQCTRTAERMRDGLAYLTEDDKARRSFQLANHAILIQQLITRDAPRHVSYDARENSLVIAEAYREPDLTKPPPGRGNWWAFQIAFLLTSLRSTADGRAADRDVVELIWFPTGGGKTEAYLGLAAFGMFRRRLDNTDDTGVHAIMRYTLRLLTAQQFQRASGLVCAMERLRAGSVEELGETSFSIGIWLGGDTTPNTRGDAIKSLSEFAGSRFANNPFLLTRCPWCGAEFGRVEVPSRSRNKKRNAMTPGYVRIQEPGWSSATVRFQCPDHNCPFSFGLPIYVVDDDIYEVRPTLIIGTIDKFAMLAWRPQARALFGLAETGERVDSPPGLIIQDELHLIAGPLGSLTGLYETAISELCTDHRQIPAVSPKIVSSTATIRRYSDQIRDLYARSQVALFPPPGLDAGDSFFARYERDRPGRVYVGVHAASLGSVQTEWVRTLSVLLQAPTPLSGEERDPWWTVLAFFNSIREMGTAHTLLQSDIPDYARVIWERQGTSREHRRYLRHVRELTGGLRSDEITGAIGDLEVGTTDAKRTPIDVCLASSIIEVGIDIPRLSLMVVAGQPKTTSQYIQVTGRVGRSRDRPGLVVTMYSPSKPRDRSHFERFRSYHERLYANVEPTSVTPFSAPALERALHAILVAYARQQGGTELAGSPWPFPEHVIERFRELILSRAQIVDPAEIENVTRVLDRRAAQWRAWHRTRWDGRGTGEDTPLLRIAGAYASPEDERLSWATLMSMRNVDAECEAEITTRYIESEDWADA